MADACADWAAGACAELDAELVHAASETVARQSEIADLTPMPGEVPSSRRPQACMLLLSPSPQSSLAPPARLYPMGWRLR